MTQIDIHNHPDWFFCESQHAWINKKWCVKYQEWAAQAKENKGPGMFNFMVAVREVSCGDCEQGRKILEQWKEKTEMPKEVGKSKEKSKLNAKQLNRLISDSPVIALRYPCSDCGIREAVDRNGKPLVHGRCNECHKIAIAKASERKKMVVTLNFKDHPQVFETLEKRADDQLRTVEAQMMWDLLQAAGE
jgi:hypothetical protein